MQKVSIPKETEVQGPSAEPDGDVTSCADAEAAVDDDFELAKKLQAEFDFESKFHLNGVRRKSSRNPYPLRAKKGVNADSLQQLEIDQFLNRIEHNNNY